MIENLIFPHVQDTMVSLQALSEYAQKADVPDIGMTCDISATDGGFQKHWEINPGNALVLQHTEPQVK